MSDTATRSSDDALIEIFDRTSALATEVTVVATDGGFSKSKVSRARACQHFVNVSFASFIFLLFNAKCVKRSTTFRHFSTDILIDV